MAAPQGTALGANTGSWLAGLQLRPSDERA